ncbi:MAG: hypothetical protein R3E60_02195 [Alphaproteobacteria bacterium]
MTTLYPCPAAVPGAHYGGIPEAVLHTALHDVAARDPDLAKAIARVGLPSARGRMPGFPTLLRVIVSQQLSTKAAATIYGRLIAKVKSEEPKPEAVLRLSITELRGIGLSERKASYAHGLAKAVIDGTLNFDRLAEMGVEEAVTTISSLRGFGRWSAEMYLLFALGHTDVWPVDDLAVVVAVQRLKGLRQRPDKKRMEKIGKAWRPYRGCVAIFLWHYYGAATLDEATAVAVKGSIKATPKIKKKTNASKAKAKSKPRKVSAKSRKKKSLAKSIVRKVKSTTKSKPSKKAINKKANGKNIKKASSRRPRGALANPHLAGRRAQGRRMPTGRPGSR